jgi:hypothetical protein
MRLSNDLLERVVEAVVLGGLSRNQAALHFKVSIASPVRWVKRFRSRSATESSAGYVSGFARRCSYPLLAGWSRSAAARENDGLARYLEIYAVLRSLCRGRLWSDTITPRLLLRRSRFRVRSLPRTSGSSTKMAIRLTPANLQQLAAEDDKSDDGWDDPVRSLSGSFYLR